MEEGLARGRGVGQWEAEMHRIIVRVDQFVLGVRFVQHHHRAVLESLTVQRGFAVPRLRRAVPGWIAGHLSRN